MKKYLVMVIMMMFLVGCGKPEDKEPQAVTPNPTVDSNSQIIVEGFGNNDEETKLPVLSEIEDAYPDKKVINVVYNYSIAMIDKKVNDKINQLLSEKNKDYVLFFEYIDEEVYADRVNSRIKAGNAPDIICAGVGMYGTLQGTRRAFTYDWFEPLDEYLKTDEGKELWNCIPERLWEACVVNKSYYGICAMLPYNSQYAYVVNKELMNKYDISEADIEGKSIAELQSVFEKVKEDNIKMIDLGNNIGLDKSNVITGISEVVDNSGHQNPFVSFYNDSLDGEAVNIFTDDRIVEQLKVIADYRKKGYFAEADNAFLVRCYINDFNVDDRDEKIEEIKNKYSNMKDCIVIEEAPYIISGYWNNLTGVSKESSNKEYAKDALTQMMCDEEITTLILYGIEGEDYQIDSGLIDAGNSIKSMYYGNPFLSKQNIHEPENKEEVFETLIEKMRFTPNVGKYYDLADCKEQVTEIEKIAKEYVGVFSGEYEDVDATIEEINNKLSEAGIDVVLETINKQEKEQRRSDEKSK